ncbi:MAG: FAD-binding oxidoreductase [Alphaproteobacteria bacterium]|nr:MAG: FAD-binding oxidoreductase [Alphaproteobacteria bacterium]
MAQPGPNITRRGLMAGASSLGVLSLLPLAGCSGKRTLPLLSLDGRVIAADAADYEAWRTGVVWQSRKPARRPAMIVRPNTVEAVQQAVDYARKNGLKVSTKSSGHNLWGNYLRDEGMLIDMWNFRKVEMDADGESAWIEPSVWSRDIMVELGKKGRAFPAAHCASVGMGGYMLGGGVGLNWENWGGLSAHNIIAAEVVTADGKLRLIDDENDPDLAWALRGAGNGFPAIVTRFRVKTYPAPKIVTSATYIFPVARTADAIAWLEDMKSRDMLANSEPLIILAHSPTAPPDATGPDAKVCVARINLFANDESAAAQQLAKIAAEPVAASALMQIPREDWSFEESYFDTLNFRVPFNYGYFGVDSIWTDRTSEALPVLADHFAQALGAGSHVVMSLIDPAEHPSNSCARIHGKLYIGLYSIGSTPEQGEAAIGWLRDTANALSPFASGRYINEIDVERDAAKVESCFSPEDWTRLQSVRQQYDPEQVFQQFLGT